MKKTPPSPKGEKATPAVAVIAKTATPVEPAKVDVLLAVDGKLEEDTVVETTSELNPADELGVEEIDQPYTEIMEPYLETYLDEKEFHITSDGQVFLKRNATDAKRHQAQLDPEQEVFVYQA